MLLMQGATDIAKVDDVEMNDAEGSLANVFYARDSEVGINEQINHEYVMSYVYHQMSSYFNRDNVSLPGLRDFFKASSLEERSHAQQLMVCLSPASYGCLRVVAAAELKPEQAWMCV